MGNAAFVRARRFLNYNPLAKWAALAGGTLTGILYVVLLLVLALFIDLMVDRGEIPAFADLSLPAQNQFLNESLDADDARKELIGMGMTGSLLRLLNPEPQQGWSARELELRQGLLWYGSVGPHLESHVNADAASAFREALTRRISNLGPELAVSRNLADFAALGRVVRTRGTLSGNLLAALVSWNSWMWMYGNQTYLIGLFAVAVSLALLRSILMFFAGYMAARATTEAATRLRRAVYHHTYRRGTLAFRALGPSEAVGVSTRHLEAVHDGLYGWLTLFFREPIKLGLLLACAMVVHFWLALAFMLFALIVWLVGGQVAAYFRRQGRSAAHRAADQLALIQESIMLMRLVKVYLMELFNQARVERQLARYNSAQIRRFRGEAFYRAVFLFLGLAAALVLLLLMGVIVLEGRLGVTSGLVLVSILISMYWPLASWLEQRRLIRRGRESAAILFSFLDRPKDIGQVVEAEFLPALSKQIEFDEVSLEEPGTGRKLLQGVSLTIPAGQRIAIVGPEDMEKHALVYLIPRFLDPSSGEIRIDRKNLRWVTLDSLRAQIAIVLQHNLVFNDTVANNIGCGDPSFNLPKIIEAAKIAHAHQFIQKLPQGYETLIGEMGEPLRIGAQFRIALARAILRDPALLIIEEPPVTLDDDTKSLLDDTYARVLPGRTTIFLPHRLSTIRNCDRVFFLYNGKVEAAGEHRELLTQNELYRHLQYMEFNEFAGMFDNLAPNSPIPEL